MATFNMYVFLDTSSTGSRRLTDIRNFRLITCEELNSLAQSEILIYGL